MDTKNCEWCSDEFTPKYKNSRYCYKQHYTQCSFCSNSILIKEMKRVPKYCSVSCSSKDSENRPSYDLVCNVCGDHFTSSKKNSRFCHKDHTKECENCHREFVFVAKDRIPRTCSKKCAAALIDFDSRNKKTSETLTEKYGVPVTNASQLDFVKEKKKEASLKKYGVENPSQNKEVQEKRRLTNLQRYGVDNGGGAPEAQRRIKITNQKKYGVDNVFQAEEIKKKIKNTLQERYGIGIVNPSQVKEISERIKKTNLEKYGVESILSLPHIQKMSSASQTKKISSVNKNWKETLKSELKVDFELEVNIADKVYADLAFGNIAIDINPTVTHNSTVSFVHITKRCSIKDCSKEKHAPRSMTYHQERFLKAEENGIQLLQYFDWMDKDIFISIVRSKLHLDENKVFARKCEVREISQKDANIFLRENHLLGATKGQSFCVGLFYEGQLVHVNTYGKPRLNKQYEWEAIRSCSKMNWHVQGGLQKCDSFFKKVKNPRSIVSYVDLALSTGSSEASNPGWSLLSTNKSSGMWVKFYQTEDNDSTPMFVRESSVRRLSADRLLGMEIGSRYPLVDSSGSNITNEIVLLSEGYVQVFDPGTRTFVYFV